MPVASTHDAMPGPRFVEAVALVLVLFLSIPNGSAAQEPPGTSSPAAPQRGDPTGPGGLISGLVTTQIGSLPLAGASVTLVDSATGQQIAAAASDEDGKYRITPVASGVYEVRVLLQGFAPLTRTPVRVEPGQHVRIDFDMPVAQVNEQVEVVGESRREEGERAERVPGNLGDVIPLQGDDFRALLPTVPGVVRSPDGRIILKGSRPSQTGVQVNMGIVNDPSTGEFGFDLPVDAVESVDVIANPYGAELGGFSSGLTRIDTRSGTNAWRFSVKNFFPNVRFRNGKLRGISSFGPRVQIGGPIVKDRLFFMQSLQYEKQKTRISAAPDPFDDIELRRFGSFTRGDLRLGVSHAFTATGSTFWRNRDYVTLGVLNPQSVTPSSDEDGMYGSVAEAWTVSPTVQLESSLFFKGYSAVVFGQGDDPMELWPDTSRGSYFNEHDRRTRTYQWNETFTMLRGSRGEHLMKVGLDLLRTSYTGTSLTRPILIRRIDGTLAERVDFTGASAQSAGSTVLTLFAQDHWRLGTRVALDGGLRFEREGILDRINIAPRAGVTAAVLPDARGVLRGGAGFFHERTPLNFAAFRSYEHRTVTRFAADGVTPLTPAVTFAHVVAPELETSYGRTWNIEYDHRLSAAWVMKVSHLQRRGRNHLLIDPLGGGEGAQLLLSSTGQSRYDETEVTAEYRPRDDFHLTTSYVRARSTSDLNTYDTFFGHLRTPVIRANERARTNVDVPHRLLVQGTLTPKWKITLAPLVEWRSGFPYSVVNEFQDFVELRNTRRFPNLFTVDLAVTRPVRVKGRSIVLGVRAYHLLRNFEPLEVYNNTGAPQFGTFVNPIRPKFSLVLQFGK